MPALKPKGKKITVEDEGGVLVCTQHLGRGWCSHISLFVDRHNDARDDAGVPILLGARVSTPIVPTNNWFVEVVLNDAKPNSHGAREVEIVHNLTPVTLGYLCPGEGRHVLREMFLDWLMGEMKKADGIKCTSPTHRPVQRNATLAQRLQEAWMLLENGLCADCSQYLDFESDAPQDV